MSEPANSDRTGEYAHPVPQLGDVEIVALVAEPFGIAAIERRYPSERDLNLLCRTREGRRVLLKISNAGEKREVLEFQCSLLERVNEFAAWVGVPEVIRAADGQSIVELKASDQNRYFARLLSFLDGVPLADIGREATQTTGLWRAIGRRLGGLSAALADWEPPASREENFLWSLDHTDRALGWRSEIADGAIVTIAEDFVRDRLPLIERFRRSARKSVLYGDANDHNVLVSQSEPRRPVGFIDFGDAGWGSAINDLAICLAYMAMHGDDPIAIFEQVVGGFATKCPISEVELEILPDLVMLRLIQSLCISSHNAKVFPQNAPYLTISQKQAVRLLSVLSALRGEAIVNRLRLACGFGPLDIDPDLSQTSALLARRRSRIAPSLSVAYSEPATIVRGAGCYLYDDTGRSYLDLVNNVAHVGHAHPHVTSALARQAALLNTNARYLHPILLDYADRIVATLPAPLSVCIFTCTGSEANDLALRMARTVTGRRDAIVLDMAYHGHSDALIEISPYKFARRGGAGRAPTTHVAAMPDPYRGLHRGFSEATGIAYGQDVDAAVRRSVERGGPALFIAESFLGVGGQVILPPRFLETAYAAVRGAGGICIADEVQVGFGRPGDTMWAFEQQHVVPDIVTLGKPIGAGHPMAAVVTTAEIAARFANGMEYFNTFGGNPVSCAVGMAVLDVIEDEDLMANAVKIGGYIQEQLSDLAKRHAFIGDVRGQGLFIGAEIVVDQETRQPDTALARRIVRELRHRGVFLSTDGPDDNVLKIKPPMVITAADVDLFIDRLSGILADA